MVDTRSSPSRRRKGGGRPPLPTNKKKAKAKKKAPSKVTKAAKQQVVEEAGKVYIKPEPELKAGGHFAEEEDIYSTRGFSVFNLGIFSSCHRSKLEVTRM